MTTTLTTATETTSTKITIQFSTIENYQRILLCTNTKTSHLTIQYKDQTTLKRCFHLILVLRERKMRNGLKIYDEVPFSNVLVLLTRKSCDVFCNSFPQLKI